MKNFLWDGGLVKAISRIWKFWDFQRVPKIDPFFDFWEWPKKDSLWLSFLRAHFGLFPELSPKDEKLKRHWRMTFFSRQNRKNFHEEAPLWATANTNVVLGGHSWHTICVQPADLLCIACFMEPFSTSSLNSKTARPWGGMHLCIWRFWKCIWFKCTTLLIKM